MEICGKTLIVKDHTGQRLPDLICSREHGHTGNHQDECGAVWMNTNDMLAKMQPPASINYRHQ